MRLLDRYVLRQVFWPFALGLLVFTFLLVLPELNRYGEDYVSKGVPLVVVAQLIVALLPYSLALTIPMSLLLGLLVAFGRLSADREFVALQACGISLARLFRPVGLLSFVCCATTAYVYMVLIPVGNQTFREITFNVVAASAEGEVKPRVFFDQFPDIVLYARAVPPAGGWDGVFLADSRPADGAAIYLARRGRVIVDREKKTVDLLLEDGARHSGNGTEYSVQRFDRQLVALNPGAMFPGQAPPPGDREMTVPQLRARVAEYEAAGRSARIQRFEIQKRFSIPAACLVFGLLGLVFGATNRRDTRLGSFVLGLGVIFAYYVLLWFGQSLVDGYLAPPWWGAWMPNIVLGGVGLLLFLRRDRLGDRPLRVPFPRKLRTRLGARTWVLGHTWLPFGILDRYVALIYLRVLGLSVTALAGVFYVSTFLDLADEVFKGNGTWRMLGAFFVYATPQFFYYIIPLSVLLATLVSIAVLTKSSELVVMKACGISLYRVALPMLLGAVAAGSLLFGMEQTVLGPANRRADAMRDVVRGAPPEMLDVLNRRWVVGRDGTIYHYEYFDPRSRRFIGISVYEFDAQMHRVARRTFADHVSLLDDDRWQLEQGWTREFDPQGEPAGFAPFARTERTLEPPSLFSSEPPDPRFMNFTQLREYTERLGRSGFDVVRQRVALWRKLSFPFVTVVMTLIAVPFAVTVGRSGAMTGIGVGIAIAVVYWTAILFFAAMGSGGLITPALAAWAPNLLFGAGAVYLLFTVRT